MNDITFSIAEVVDAYRIQMRPSDLHEGNIWVPGYRAQDVLASSISTATEAFSVFEGDELIAITGYYVDNHEVYPWMMCSERVAANAKTLMRAARSVLKDLKERYPDHLICNHVAKANKQARAFITALGFRTVPCPGSGEFDFFYLP